EERHRISRARGRRIDSRPETVPLRSGAKQTRAGARARLFDRRIGQAQTGRRRDPGASARAGEAAIPVELIAGGFSPDFGEEFWRAARAGKIAARTWRIILVPAKQENSPSPKPAPYLYSPHGTESCPPSAATPRAAAST